MFIRGKIKFVYDCEFSLKIKGINDFYDVRGEIKLKEVHNHDLDDDFEVKLIILNKNSMIFLEISKVIQINQN